MERASADSRPAMAGAWETSMWSTRSGASMNDIDVDDRRLRMGRRGDGLSCSLASPAGDAAVTVSTRPIATLSGTGGWLPQSQRQLTTSSDIHPHL